MEEGDKPSKPKKAKTSNKMSTTTTAASSSSPDLLSNLPTTLLHHILSFLPAKPAVQTSVLSKRFQYLWTSIPSLKFDHSIFPTPHHSAKPDYFMNFIDQFLLHRDSSSIQSFSIKCNKSCDNSRIKTWISYAINHNVQQLDLRIIGDIHLPLHLFTCKSLKVLRLNLSGTSLKFPNCETRLPNLETLELSYVSFEDKKFATKFFSSCPVLENLVLKDCEFGRIFFFSAPQLKNLVLLCLTREPVRVCRFKVLAGSLRSFKYKGYFGLNCCLENASQLCKVDLDLWKCKDHLGVNVGFTKRFGKMLLGFFYVEVVRLSVQTLEMISAELSILESQPSPLCGLQSLKVTALDKHFVLPNKVINYLLKCSPSAKTYIEFVEEVKQ